MQTDQRNAGAPPDAYERRYMNPTERVLFREKVVSRRAFRAFVVFALAFGLFGLCGIAAGALVAPYMAAIGALSASLGAAMGILGVMFSVFRVMVTAENVYIHFGWVKRKIPLDAIESVRDLPVTGLRQGGVKTGFDGVVRTWAGSSASGRGVEIAYQQDSQRHVLTLGSEDAARFVETVERARASTTRIADGVVAAETTAETTEALSLDEDREERATRAR